MAYQEQVDRLRQGVKDWNAWRAEQPLNNIDLSHADLRYANLSYAALSHADLTSAILTSADLRYAIFTSANLSDAYLRYVNFSEANLSYANLSYADLRYANLTSANLSRADLSYADLSNADLSYANLSRAILIHTKLKVSHVGFTIFGNLDLRTVQGLETVDHKGPSTIGTDTIVRSAGDIPEVFLRGAGLTNTFITYARSLVQNPLEYYTCFISYSSTNEDFARRLYADLQSHNVRCWFAPEDLDVGDKIRHRIDESIRLYDKLLLVLSKDSIASNWVAYEVEKALNKEPQGISNVLFPIRIDDTILTCNTQWAQDIKHTRYIGDFTHWKDHDTYQKSLERLLRDLKAKSNR